MNDHRKQPYVTWGLIAVNVLYFLYVDLTGSSNSMEYMLQKGALYVPYVLDGQYYRLLLSVFMHFGISHLVNNMLVLFVLGDQLERAMGRIRYLVFYLCCGIGANLVSVAAYLIQQDLFQTADNVVSAGASGAIFGVAGGLLYVVLANRGRLENLNTRQIAVMLVLSLYLGFRSAGTDNLAHLSGAVIGFLLAVVLYRREKWRS